MEQVSIKNEGLREPDVNAQTNESSLVPPQPPQQMSIVLPQVQVPQDQEQQRNELEQKEDPSKISLPGISKVYPSFNPPNLPKLQQDDEELPKLVQDQVPSSSTLQQPPFPQQMMYMPMYGYNQYAPYMPVQQVQQVHQQQPQQPQQPQQQQPVQPPQQPQQPPQQQPPQQQQVPTPVQSHTPMQAPGGGMNVKDALSYLEQVKKQFSSKPDVYNHFLDIMKDFKSESIDTPGVIDRVSSLFRGHNNLIQGFNAFLPEGFRIVCSSDPSDPNPVKVLTPSGSHVLQQQPQQQQQQQQQQQEESPSSPNSAPNQENVQQQVHHAQQMHLHRQQINANAHMHVAHQQQGPSSPYYVDEQQQEQQQQQQQQQQDRPAEPVDINHAINYVNKVKTHFSSQPDVYKQFLDILQTYQREQMRIPDVYSQMHLLFKDAPDLLEGFKTFLPDTGQDQPVLDVQLPPVGSFGPAQQQPIQMEVPSGVGNAIAAMSAGINAQTVQHVPVHQQQQQQQQQVPQMPPQMAPHAHTHTHHAHPHQHQHVHQQPLAPPTGIQAPVSSLRGEVDLVRMPYNKESLQSDVAFFDKVKKTLPKPSYHEFLKVLNLFTQQIIDVPELVQEVEPFLSPTPDLFDWFKQFVSYEEKPLHIENIAFRKHLVDLSQCRAYGRSYRLLPKTERYMPCSGRDELGREVFNDEWVGHPTWASEDSGFVAHRKNQYEEIMFRVEEERHEYDHWIGACQRTIQVLEVIANRLAVMSPNELSVFKLPEGLGHGTKIYQKVIRKIYDKKNGDEVINALHENPGAAVPVVLRRLKQKDEEWRRAHREWKKVWREAERKAFYKSLDHVGLTFKQADRKQLTPRALLAEIMMVKAEQGAKRKLAATNLQPLPTPKSQLDYLIKDYDVINDLKNLIIKYVDHRPTMSAHDKALCKKFLNIFVDEFFTLGPITEKNIEQLVESETSAEDSTNADAESKDAESKDAESKDADGDVEMADPVPTLKQPAADTSTDQVTSSSWLKVDRSTPPLDEKPQKRSQYNLFASTSIYLFMRIFETLYSRLVEVKNFEDVVSQTLSKSRRTPFAVELGLYDSRLEAMGLQFTADDPYKQTLNLCNRLLEEELEVQWFEEALRQAYRNRAYKLYTIDKALQSLVKQLHAVVTDPASIKALLLWEEDRAQEETSVRSQIELRMRAKQAVSGALSGDGYLAAESSEPLFRISWHPSEHKLSFQHIGPFDITLKGEMDSQQRWDYYVTSYTMSLPTEGVPLDLIRAPVLQRTVPTDGSGYRFEVLLENLVARIAYGSYKLVFEPDTADYIVNTPPTKGDQTKAKEERNKLWSTVLHEAEEALKESEAEALQQQPMKPKTVEQHEAPYALTPAMLAAQPRLEQQKVDVVLP